VSNVDAASMSTVGSGVTPPDLSELRRRSSRRWHEEGIKGVMFVCALLSVVVTIGIIVVLATEAAPFFRHISIWEFLTDRRWFPLLEPRHFGVLPLLGGTLLIVIGSALLGIPVGLASGIYLSEYASGRMRSIIKPVLESVDERAAIAMKADIKTYDQVMVKGANHFFQGKAPELVKHVGDWIAKTAAQK